MTTAVYMVNIETLGQVGSDVGNTRSYGSALHEVTVRDGVASDRVIESPNQLRMLLAASYGFAVEIEALKGDGSDPLAIVDLTTGASRSLGSMSSLGIDDTGREGGAVSPDGSQVAIGSNHKVVLIEVTSGSERTLVTTSDRNVWFIPLRWTSGGIIVGEVGFEGFLYGTIASLDPQTGQITALGGPAQVVSPDDQWLAWPANLDLGDGSAGRGGWLNSLNLRRLGGPETRIITTPYRNFTPLDVSNDGQLLFNSDTSSGRTVTPDLGLYLATNGQVVQQLPESAYGEFGAEFYGGAALLDPTTALVARIRGGFDGETSLDVELVHLCAHRSGGCTVTTTAVSSTPGIYPTATQRFLIVPATN